MYNLIIIGISAALIAFGLLWLRKLKGLRLGAEVDVGAMPGDALSPEAGAGAMQGDASNAETDADAGANSMQSDASNPEIDAKTAKRLKLKKILAIAAATLGGFLFITQLIDVIFGPAVNSLGDVSIVAERVDVFGVSVGITIVLSWVAMALLIIGAIILRLTAFAHPNDIPTKAQNVIETIVEAVGKYTNAQAHGTGEMLCSYILTIGAFLIMCAFLELFRLRPPTSDITVTLSLALMTFILINVYGIRRKGFIGRIKSLASPTPIVFPFRLISEIAIPVSLACRLFGNMLGGMIVIDLLYSALGNHAVGIPGVLGLYFNAFHPLIQAFIFVTLTLTFINEAIEIDA